MNVLIVRNGANAAALDASMLLATYLNTQSINYTILDSSELSRFNGREHEVRTILHDVELAVVLAGDGTILHTARLIQGTTIPLLGLNFGQLGFLANSGNLGIIESVSAALSGELLCEHRTNLQIDVVCHGDRDPFDDTNDSCNAAEDSEADDCACGKAGARANACESEPTPAFGVHRGGCYGQRRFFALNEITINRGALGRIIDFSLDISDNHIADIRGDGLLIATATGSTAYALSAGGPLVAPSFSGLIAVPLAPHTLRTRALLTGANDVICVTLPNKDANREATLVIDGDRLLFNQPVERVYVRRGAEPTRLLRTGEENFYEHVARTFF